VEPQFSGRNWETAFTSRSTWATYDFDGEVFDIKSHDSAAEMAQYIGAMPVDMDVFDVEPSDLSALLPAYAKGPDLTMTMAG
jgi:hypothetical protein